MLKTIFHHPTHLNSMSHHFNLGSSLSPPPTPSLNHHQPSSSTLSSCLRGKHTSDPSTNSSPPYRLSPFWAALSDAHQFPLYLSSSSPFLMSAIFSSSLRGRSVPLHHIYHSFPFLLISTDHHHHYSPSADIIIFRVILHRFHFFKWHHHQSFLSPQIRNPLWYSLPRY